MKMFIVQLLQGDRTLTPQQLYKFLSKSGDKNRNKEGGLGSAFKPKKRWAIVSEAFNIDDALLTVAIQSIEKLYTLAHLYKANVNKYAICLALIVFLEKPITNDDKTVKRNLTFASTALDELAELYKKEGPLKDIHINELGIPISEIIKRKKLAYTAVLGAGVVSKLQVTRTTQDNFQKNSRHTFTHVTLKTAAATGKADCKADSKTDSKNVKTESEKAFIQKQEVPRRIANFEAYSGTLMELYNGPNQPTIHAVKAIGEFTEVLSEKLDFQPFGQSEIIKAWAEEGFRGAAEIDIACLDIGENDYHLDNGGKRKDNGAPVRIDFDQSYAERTFIIKDSKADKHLKIQRVNGKEHLLGKLTWTEGYNFHEDDLTNLPNLPNVNNKVFTDFELSEHYAPTNWWTFSDILPISIQSKIQALPQQENYLKAKFRSMLEKIILPQEIYHIIAEHIPFDTEDHAFVMTFRTQRRMRWKDKAPKTKGFIQYILSEGETALKELKIRLQNFLDKRTDIFNPKDLKLIKKIMSQYDANFREYLETFPKPAVDDMKAADSKKVIDINPRPDNKKEAFDAKAADLSKVIDVNKRIDLFLSEMHRQGLMEEIVRRKQTQFSYFLTEIKKLSLEELEYLNDLMNKVQLGVLKNEAFDVIRTERTNCLGGGNTKTWRGMRTAVKTCILDQLKKDNTRLQTNYLSYAGLFNQHSGRCYSRWGKTNTLKQFSEHFSEERFSLAKKNN